MDRPGLLEAGRYRSISSVRTILHTACRILLLPRHRLEYYSYTDQGWNIIPTRTIGWNITHTWVVGWNFIPTLAIGWNISHTRVVGWNIIPTRAMGWIITHYSSRKMKHHYYTGHRMEYYSCLSRRMEYYSCTGYGLGYYSYSSHGMEYYSYTDHRVEYYSYWVSRRMKITPTLAIGWNIILNPP